MKREAARDKPVVGLDTRCSLTVTPLVVVVMIGGIIHGGMGGQKGERKEAMYVRV